MQIRKFLVTIHEDGSVSALEFEEPENVMKDVQYTAFRRGYMSALFESRKKVQEFRDRREDSREANLMYAAVASVHQAVCDHLDFYMP